MGQANEANSGIPYSDPDLIKVAKWSARESARVNTRFRGRFTNTSRVIRVLGGFAARADFNLAAVQFENAAAGADVFAIAGYIGPDRRFVDDQSRFDNLTLDEIFEEITDGRHLQSGASLVDLSAIYSDNYTLAFNHGLDLILYEVGQHIVSIDAPAATTDRMLATNGDPRMGIAYQANFNHFRTANGTLMFNFIVEDMWNENGSFGLLQYQNDNPDLSPKYQAVKNFIDTTPCWWSGC